MFRWEREVNNLTILEAGSWTAGHHQGWGLLRLLPCSWRWRPRPLHVFSQSPPSVRDWVLVSSSQKDTCHIGPGPTLLTLFSLQRSYLQIFIIWGTGCEDFNVCILRGHIKPTDDWFQWPQIFWHQWPVSWEKFWPRTGWEVGRDSFRMIQRSLQSGSLACPGHRRSNECLWESNGCCSERRRNSGGHGRHGNSWEECTSFVCSSTAHLLLWIQF